MARRENLRTLIAGSRMSIAEVARKAGLSRQAVMQWIAGAVEPWPHKVQMLADALGVPVARVMAAVAASRRR